MFQQKGTNMRMSTTYFSMGGEAGSENVGGIVADNRASRASERI